MLEEKAVTEKNFPRKYKAAILGTGNIGKDLIMKVRRTKRLEC